MSTTAQQDKAFVVSVISLSLLEEAIDWISHNLEPEDVFDDANLREWARDNGFVEEEG